MAVALNTPHGGCESFPAVLWGQPAGRVPPGQVQGNYLRPEEALKARPGNLMTLFMTPPPAKDKVPPLSQWQSFQRK